MFLPMILPVFIRNVTTDESTPNPDGQTPKHDLSETYSSRFTLASQGHGEIVVHRIM